MNGDLNSNNNLTNTNLPSLPLTTDDISKFHSYKWNEKCEKCESLIKFINNNKIFDYDYQTLLSYIEINLNDPNIKVSTKMLTFLIQFTQLRTNDSNYKLILQSVLPKIVNKYKDKKDKLNDDINVLLMMILREHLSLYEFLSAIKQFPFDKSAIVKTSLAEFIMINLRKTLLSELLGENLNLVIEIFNILVKDSNLDVKNCSLSCLALVRKRVGRENFEGCEEAKKIGHELRFDIEQVGQNINYDKKYDDVNNGEEEEEIEEEVGGEVVEEVEEEDEDEDEEMDNKNNKDNEAKEIIDEKGEQLNDDKENEVNKEEKENSNVNEHIEEKLINDKQKEKNDESKKICDDLINSDRERDINNEKEKKAQIVIIDNKKKVVNNNKFREKVKVEIKVNKNEKFMNIKSSNVEETSIIKEETKNKIDIKDEIKLKDKEEEQLKSQNQNTEENVNNQQVKSSLNEFERKLAMALQQEEQTQKEKQDTIDNIHIVKKPIKKTEEDQQYTDKLLALTKDQSILDCFETTKWEEKKKGLTQINKYINDKKSSLILSKDDQDTLFNFIRIKINNFKETNFNILKEAFICFTSLSSLPLDKKFISTILKGVHEKIADSKLKETTIQLLNQMIESYGPFYIASQITPLLLNKKAKLQVMKEYCSFFEKVIDDYGIDQLDIKELISFSVNLANNSNPTARASATGLICSIYKYIGNDIKVLIKDIKESTLKIIEGEMGKVKVLDKKEIKPKKKVVQDDELKPKEINKDLIPRVDISKHITSKILNSINTGKWGEKKEAVELVQKVLTQANNKILPNGLKELMSVLKSKLGDSNKNLVRLVIQLLSQLIEALGPGLKQYAKILSVPLLSTFADKQSLLKEDCHICIDKWITSYNFESIISYCPQLLKTENFELRTEILKVFIKYKDKFTKGFSEGFFKEIIPSFILCLQDKASSIRNQIEEMIIVSLKFIPKKYYLNEIKELKPVIAHMLTEIIERICKENNIETDIDDSSTRNSIWLNNGSKENSKKSLNLKKNQIQKVMSKTPSKKNMLKKTIAEKDARINTTPNNASAKKNKNENQKPIENGVKKDKCAKKRILNKNLTEKTLTASSMIISHKIKLNTEKSPEKNINSIFIKDFKLKQNTKAKRSEIDKKTKFNIESQNYDYIAKIKDQSKIIFTSDHNDKMFNDDIKKNILAINSIKNNLLNKNTKANTIEVLDIILKQIGWKLSKSQNPSLIKSFYELCECIEQVYTEDNIILNQTESNILFNLLSDKLTSSNSSFKDNSRNFILSISNNIGNPKAFNMLITIALAKQGKVKSEMVEIINTLYSTKEIDESTLSKNAKAIMKLYNSADSSTKAKIIPLIKEIYNVAEEEIVKYINELNEKERKFLFEKIKQENEKTIEQRDTLSCDNEREVTTEEKSLFTVREEVKEEKFEDENEEMFNMNKGSDQINKPIIRVRKNDNFININEDNENNTNGITPISKEKLENILSSLNNPRNIITQSILVINETVYKNHAVNLPVLVENADLIFTTFIKSITGFFSSSPLQVKIIKYITNVLYKISTVPEIISNISFNTLDSLIFLMLSSVLYDNLRFLGENQEGMLIWKSLNKIMLKIIEYCNTNDILKILIQKEREYRKSKPKLVEYSAKCIMKLIETINQKIDNLKIPEILGEIHLFLIDYGTIDENKQLDCAISSLKNLVFEFTKIKGVAIIEDYIKGVEIYDERDKYIKKWMRYCLDNNKDNKMIKEIKLESKEKKNVFNIINESIKEQIAFINSEGNTRYQTIQHEQLDILKQKLSTMNKSKGIKSIKETINNSRAALNNKSFNQIQKKWKDVSSRTQENRIKAKSHKKNLSKTLDN